VSSKPIRSRCGTLKTFSNSLHVGHPSRRARQGTDPWPRHRVPVPPIDVFFSYSHRDAELRDELAKHLHLLQRQGVIRAWHDRQIGAGTAWRSAIDAHLQTARIILLLVSADFLASDYCFDVEMQRALARHEAGEARVIPVILRAVDWQGAPFAKLQALPTDGKPVMSWANRDEAFLNVAQGIRGAVEEIVGHP